MPTILQTLLTRIRRNHGLEHATINILSQRYPGLPLAGHSNADGFWLLGDIPTEAVQTAVEDALRRMKSGESHLAIAPFCGTNLVTAGMLSGLAGAMVMWGAGPRWRDRLDRLPLAMAFATLALLVGFPLGTWLQARLTTSAQPGDLQVIEILRTRQGQMVAHRVTTRG